ncbi:outer membrane lipoprotein-sorting protein [Xanthomonas hydrangeae]|uniref:Outer membrane lipoprotein-sorting protein n=1 Tax=Xanthomonas hydrangeae TaxID=2775159 RepID=A0AAU0B5D3_9XANT|nr:outer membrane lipoprotein-sorting protein [Xanthomonas hydrangeae]WOB47934.1 outer membrane lipoprotein-sorting protein [Xanthomonas hydrangeae]
MSRHELIGLKKLRWVTFLALAITLLVPRAAIADELQAHALLARSDEIRNPGRSFRVDVELLEYRSGAQANTMALQVFARAEPGQDRFGNIVRFAKPVQDMDKLMLFQGKDLWFYDPDSKASFRLSPQQRLMGQAANGDVLAVRLATDYSAALAGRETIIDATKAPRECDHLVLEAKTPQAVYAKIEFWQDATTAEPIKARFYSDSSQLLKTAFYRRPVTSLGRLRPSEVLIIDGLNSSLVTLMRYTNYAWQDVPAAWMQRDFLPRFRQP